MRAMLGSCWEPSTLWNNCKAFLAPVLSCSTFSVRMSCLFSLTDMQPIQSHVLHVEMYEDNQPAFRRAKLILQSCLNLSLFSSADVSRREALFADMLFIIILFIIVVFIFGAICSLLFCFCTAIPKGHLSVKHHGQLCLAFPLDIFY